MCLPGEPCDSNDPLSSGEQLIVVLLLIATVIYGAFLIREIRRIHAERPSKGRQEKGA